MIHSAKVFGTSLSVSDLYASLVWYVKHWGFEVLVVSTDKVVIGTAGNHTMLQLVQKSEQCENTSFPKLLLQVDNALETRSNLVDNGVMAKNCVTTATEIHFICSDLDGNQIQCFSLLTRH